MEPAPPAAGYVGWRPVPLGAAGMRMANQVKVQSSPPWPPCPRLSPPGSDVFRSPPLSSLAWAARGAGSDRGPPLSSQGSRVVRIPPLSSPGCDVKVVPGIVRAVVRPPLSSPGSAGLTAFLAADTFLSSLALAATSGTALATLVAREGAGVPVTESSVTRTFLTSSLMPGWDLLGVCEFPARAADPVRRMPVRDSARAALVFMFQQ